ncbi:MAG: hypothetical protein RIC56_08460 [Pseudomonadales bacterium]
MVTVSFDAANATTLGSYSGLVELEVSGDGASFDVARNDAFYVFTGPSPCGPIPCHDARYYQLALDTGTVVGFPPEEQLAKSSIVYDLDAGGEITQTTLPYRPAYRTDHVYRFVIDVSLTSSWAGGDSALFFNVSDGNYSDNAGAYEIDVFQLEPVLAPEGEPLLIQAAETPAGGTRVSVQVTGGTPGDNVPDIEILTAATCPGGFLDESATVLGQVSAPLNQLTGSNAFDADGTALVIETLPDIGAQYASARLVNGAAAGDASTCVVAGPDNDTWPRARQIELGGSSPAVGNETGFIDVPGRPRWYKFSVQPDAKATIELSSLPANYDLYLFKDIAQAFVDIAGDNDTSALDRLGAEFASTVQNTTEISPFAFSPAEISPFAFSDAGLSPFAFSSSVYAGDAVAPFAFSSADNSTSAVSPFAFSPFAFSPFAFSPFAFSPFAFSPFAFSDAYANAQTRSLIAVSAGNGTSSERVSAFTWTNTGDFYVLAVGRNGASDFEQPFNLNVSYDGGLCANVVREDLSSLAGVGSFGDYKSIILYDSSRLAMDGYPLSTQGPLRARLDALAARPEVDGVVVDLGGLATIQSLHAQADDELNVSCPFAENLVAEAIKTVIDSYRDENPDMAYVVLAGSDGQIPFFRYPDQTLLGPESQYEPPVRDLTQSQSALRKNYLLGQDEYGARTTLSLRDGRFPVPDLAVGRLVETPDEMIAMLDAYLATEAGIVATPSSTLVTGYDFLDDAANAIQSEFVAATNGVAGRRNETLIAAGNLSPQDPLSWNATQLRQVLLDQPEDVIFLAGHFNAFSALAADYTTTLDTTELLASTADLTNVLVFSAGCHSGYNAVNEEQVAGLPPDWAQAFARKQATFIGGTGYQYGDTEFIEFGERLYLEFAKKLRTGFGPIAVGDALMAAKRQYLRDEADVKGLHRKSLLISTLFGLPMLKIDMPGDRIPDDTGTSVVDPGYVVDLSVDADPSCPVDPGDGLTKCPGRELGLKYYDLANGYTLTEVTKPLTVYDDPADPSMTSTVTASYLTGLDGLIINPGEPVVPRRSLDVTLPGESLRGVGFRGGAWTNTPDIIPLVGAATTELRAPQTRFASLDFYPMRLARANYYDAISGSGRTILHTTPVQHRTEQIGDDAIRRTFANQDYRLYYSSNTQRYVTSGGSVNIPALSSAPSFTNVRVEIDGSDVLFGANVVGDPAAGVQEVWVTWTDGSQSSGVWTALDLTQSASDSRRWTGRLVGGATNDRIDAVFHAVNGVGLVSTDDNFARFYQAVVAGSTPEATALEILSPAPGDSGPSRSVLTASARLIDASNNTIAGRTVVFSLGSSIRSASTNAFGLASADLPIVSTPGDYPLSATFAGDADYLASSAEQRFEVNRSATELVLTVGTPVVAVNGVRTAVTARLTAADAAATPLIERTVFFTVTGGPEGTFTVPRITDQQGVARLGELALPAGSYGVEARFLGLIPGVLDTITDPVYLASMDSGSMTLENGPGCPTSSTKGKINVTGFCYLTGEVDGKIAITDGTLFVGGSTTVVNADGDTVIVDGVYVDQKIDQYGDGGVNVMAGAGVRGQIKESGNGGIRVAGDVGGNLTESGPGDIVVTASGTVDGNLSESAAGDVRIDGSVDGNVTEAGSGNLTIAETGLIDGKATESGPGVLVNDGTVTKTITQD